MSSSADKANGSSTDAAVTVQPKVKATPLPMEQLVPMAFVLLGEMLSISMLLPYVGLLVADLQGFSVDEAGYLSGMLVGVFMLGQVSSAKTWGWVSDQYGRRPPLIIGLFMGGLMMLFFGLSGSVWLCALFRFIHGLCNGNVLVAKTMMADITDKSNEARGFSFVSLCYGMGLLVGPGLGGILYDPANSSAMSWAGISKTGIFARHPALLPSLVLFLYSLVGVTVCVFCVKETNPKAKPLPSWVRSFVPCFWREAEQFVKQSAVVEAVETNAESGKLDDSVAAGGLETLDLQEEEQGDTFPVGVLGLHSPVLCEDVRSYDHLCLERMHENDSLHSPPSQSEVCDNKDERVQQQEVRCGDSSPREVANESGVVVVVESSQGDGQEEVKKFGYRQAFERPVTRFMLIMYMIVCGSDMIVSEVFPLWAIASTNAGGLGFDADWVGVILLLNCFPCVSANLLFPKASGRYKDKMAFFRMSIGIAAASVFAMAVAPYAPVPQSMFYVLVITTFSIRQFCCSWCYALVTMLTARSAPPGHTGAIMGINQSCGSITRVIVPFIAAPLFAWSISSPHIFPLNYALVFILSGALFSFGCWRTTSIRTTADGKLELVG